MCSLYPSQSTRRIYFLEIIRVSGVRGITERKGSGDMLAVISVFGMLIVPGK